VVDVEAALVAHHREITVAQAEVVELTTLELLEQRAVELQDKAQTV
jgi:hypothetical protein